MVTWQSEFARVPPRAPEPLNTGTLGTRLGSIERVWRLVQDNEAAEQMMVIYFERMRVNNENIHSLAS